MGEIVHTSGFGSFYTKDDEEFMSFTLSDWDYDLSTELLIIKAKVTIAPVSPDGPDFVITPTGREMTREINIGESIWKVSHETLYGAYWLKCNGYERIPSKDYYECWKRFRWMHEPTLEGW